MNYIASPYTHKDPLVMQDRFEMVCKITADLLKKYPSQLFFSPIAHSHSVAAMGSLPTNWEWWMGQDRQWLGMASRLIVCDSIPGWDESRGVQAEIGMAEEMGIEVVYLSEL